MANIPREPMLPKNATNRAIDVYYGASKYSHKYKICSECKGTDCSNCNKGVIINHEQNNTESDVHEDS